MSDLSIILINTAGVGLVAFIVYLTYYFIRKYNLESWIKKAVLAAEIIFDIPDSQEEKKAWVVDFIHKNCNLKGISEEKLDCMIEATVELINIQQQNGQLTEKDVLGIVSSYFDKQLRDSISDAVAKIQERTAIQELEEAAKAEANTEDD